MVRVRGYPLTSQWKNLMRDLWMETTCFDAQHFSPERTNSAHNNAFFEEEAFKSKVFSVLPFPSRATCFLRNPIFLSRGPVEIES